MRRHVDQIRKRELSGVIDIDPSIPQAMSIPSPVMPKQEQSPEVQASDAIPHVKDCESGPPMLGIPTSIGGTINTTLKALS